MFSTWCSLTLPLLVIPVEKCIPYPLLGPKACKSKGISDPRPRNLPSYQSGGSLRIIAWRTLPSFAFTHSVVITRFCRPCGTCFPHRISWCLLAFHVETPKEPPNKCKITVILNPHPHREFDQRVLRRVRRQFLLHWPPHLAQDILNVTQIMAQRTSILKASKKQANTTAS